MEQMWSLDALGVADDELSETVSAVPSWNDNDCRYEMGLLWKSGRRPVPNLKSAEIRIHQMSARLRGDTYLEYGRHMTSLLDTSVIEFSPQLAAGSGREGTGAAHPSVVAVVDRGDAAAGSGREGTGADHPSVVSVVDRCDATVGSGREGTGVDHPSTAPVGGHDVAFDNDVRGKTGSDSLRTLVRDDRGETSVPGFTAGRVHSHAQGSSEASVSHVM